MVRKWEQPLLVIGLFLLASVARGMDTQGQAVSRSELHSQTADKLWNEIQDVTTGLSVQLPEVIQIVNQFSEELERFPFPELSKSEECSESIKTRFNVLSQSIEQIFKQFSTFYKLKQAFLESAADDPRVGLLSSKDHSIVNSLKQCVKFLGILHVLKPFKYEWTGLGKWDIDELFKLILFSPDLELSSELKSDESEYLLSRLVCLFGYFQSQVLEGNLDESYKVLNAILCYVQKYFIGEDVHKFILNTNINGTLKALVTLLQVGIEKKGFAIQGATLMHLYLVNCIFKNLDDAPLFSWLTDLIGLSDSDQLMISRDLNANWICHFLYRLFSDSALKSPEIIRSLFELVLVEGEMARQLTPKVRKLLLFYYMDALADSAEWIKNKSGKQFLLWVLDDDGLSSTYIPMILVEKNPKSGPNLDPYRFYSNKRSAPAKDIQNMISTLELTGRASELLRSVVGDQLLDRSLELRDLSLSNRLLSLGAQFNLKNSVLKRYLMALIQENNKQLKKSVLFLESVRPEQTGLVKDLKSELIEKALELKRFDFISELWEQGFKFNFKNSKTHSEWREVLRSNPQEFRALLKQIGTDFKKFPSDFKTELLQQAWSQTDFESVKVLLERGAQFDEGVWVASASKESQFKERLFDLLRTNNKEEFNLYLNGMGKVSLANQPWALSLLDEALQQDDFKFAVMLIRQGVVFSKEYSVSEALKNKLTLFLEKDFAEKAYKVYSDAGLEPVLLSLIFQNLGSRAALCTFLKQGADLRTLFPDWNPEIDPTGLKALWNRIREQGYDSDETDRAFCETFLAYQEKGCEILQSVFPSLEKYRMDSDVEPVGEKELAFRAYCESMGVSSECFVCLDSLKESRSIGFQNCAHCQNCHQRLLHESCINPDTQCGLCHRPAPFKKVNVPALPPGGSPKKR